VVGGPKNLSSDNSDLSEFSYGSNSNIKVKSMSVWIGAAVFDDTPIAISYTSHISARGRDAI
jgi:hypothetical protein